MHQLIICLVLGFLPGIAWLIYFYSKDHYEPEPKRLVILAYFLGSLSTIPISYLYQLIPSSLPFQAILQAPIIEELTKFSILYLIFFRNKNFNEPLDGMIYGISIGLGFASLENFGYMLKTYNTSTYSATVVMRGLFTVPMHALTASFYGFGLGVKKFGVSNKHQIWYYVVFAIGAHAIFNGIATIAVVYPLLIFIAYLWKKFSQHLQTSLKNSPFSP